MKPIFRYIPHNHLSKTVLSLKIVFLNPSLARMSEEDADVWDDPVDAWTGPERDDVTTRGQRAAAVTVRGP